MKKPSRLSLAAAAAATALIASALPALAHPTHDGSGKEAGFDKVAEDVSPGGVPQERMSDVRCEDGMADIFPCQQVDLASFIPLKEMNSIWANDVWGWTDPVTGREFALAKLYEGTAFVDITDATDPNIVPAVVSNGPWVLIEWEHVIDPIVNQRVIDLAARLVGGDENVFLERLQRLIELELPAPVIGLGRRRQDLGDQGRIQEGVVMLVFEKGLIGDDHEVRVNVGRWGAPHPKPSDISLLRSTLELLNHHGSQIAQDESMRPIPARRQDHRAIDVLVHCLGLPLQSEVLLDCHASSSAWLRSASDQG